jgi:gamma-glutamylcyclotransferase (GGCT)/AIG2-like uncharacterized protein YtfP
MHRVFVYGTLKRGLLNHELIASSRFLGPAATTERFRMIADSFPVLLSYPDGLAVAGELYEVDTKTRERLDHLERVREGGGGSYERRATDVHYWCEWLSKSAQRWRMISLKRGRPEAWR